MVAAAMASKTEQEKKKRSRKGADKAAKKQQDSARNMHRTQFEHSTNKDTMPGTGSNWEVHAHTQNTTQKKGRQIERRSASLQGKIPDSVPHRESPPRPTRRSPSFPPERTESPRPHAGAPQKMRRTWRGMRRPWPQRSTPPRQRGRSDAPREWPPSAAWRACRCRLTYSHTKKKRGEAPPPPPNKQQKRSGHGAPSLSAMLAVCKALVRRPRTAAAPALGGAPWPVTTAYPTHTHPDTHLVTRRPPTHLPCTLRGPQTSEAPPAVAAPPPPRARLGCAGAAPVATRRRRRP